MSDLKTICGLYLNQTKEGEKYFSGKTPDGNTYFVFKIKNPKSEKHPTYQLSVKYAELPQPKDYENKQNAPESEDVPF